MTTTFRHHFNRLERVTGFIWGTYRPLAPLDQRRESDLYLAGIGPVVLGRLSGDARGFSLSVGSRGVFIGRPTK